MTRNEIELSEIDTFEETFYEVEIWSGGDCEGHFFRRKRDALRYYETNAKKAPDCVKEHQAERLGGTCQIIKEANPGD